jgi:hypothetical protein
MLLVTIVLAKSEPVYSTAVKLLTEVKLLVVMVLKNPKGDTTEPAVKELVMSVEVLKLPGIVEIALIANSKDPFPRIDPFTSSVTPGALQLIPRRVFVASK